MHKNFIPFEHHFEHSIPLSLAPRKKGSVWFARAAERLQLHRCAILQKSSAFPNKGPAFRTVRTGLSLSSPGPGHESHGHGLWAHVHIYSRPYPGPGVREPKAPGDEMRGGQLRTCGMAQLTFPSQKNKCIAHLGNFQFFTMVTQRIC